MELVGVVSNVIYRNEQNGYAVLEFLCDDGARCTAVGILPLASKGERLRLAGQLGSHPKYGRQFQVRASETLAPATLSAVEAYLGSGLVRGVGEATARAIVSVFGMDTLTVLDNTPERLAEIPGIGAKRMAMILESYQQNRAMRDILLALEPYGVTVGQAYKLFCIYGAGCLARIEENPYQMIQDVDGIGFITADRIARNVAGFELDSRARIRAGLTYAMQQARSEYGHCYLPRESLLRYARKLLGADETPCAETLDYMLEQGELCEQLVSGAPAVFLPALQRMEASIAERLTRLAEKPLDNPLLRCTAERAQAGLTLSGEQSHAVERALTEGVLVITGGPGTGKTTIIRAITELVSAIGMDFALTAPTGRAAKRMTEATECEAKTLHRLLEYIPGEGFAKNADDPLFYDMIIVDETSMVDVPLFSALLAAVPPGTRLILVGDMDQLPPVGPGDVLRDIITSGVLPTVRLTEIFRQSERSAIVVNAHRINEGRMPVLDATDSDFRFESIPLQDEVLARILELCAHPAPVLETREPLMDVQVLSPMKAGMLGVHNLNARLQETLNPPESGKREFGAGERKLREGDRVMQLRNDYKVVWHKPGPGGAPEEGAGAFNGDLGTIARINTETRRLSVLFDDLRLADYDFADLDEIDLAYCISIHKSQGSEFPIVLLPLHSGAPQLMTRNLLYTAVTRARRQVVCIGREDAVRRMVENNDSRRRYTALAQRLLEWKELLH